VGGVLLEGDDVPSQCSDSFGSHRVALVGHRARTDLFRLERLQQLALVLQQPDVGGELCGTLGDAAEHVEHLGVKLPGIGLSRHGNHMVMAQSARHLAL
jgi:hypothetical protein